MLKLRKRNIFKELCGHSFCKTCAEGELLQIFFIDILSNYKETQRLSIVWISTLYIVLIFMLILINYKLMYTHFVAFSFCLLHFWWKELENEMFPGFRTIFSTFMGILWPCDAVFIWLLEILMILLGDYWELDYLVLIWE